MTTSGYPRHWRRFLLPRFIVDKVREHGLNNCLRIAVVRVKDKVCRITLETIDNVRNKGKKQNNVLYAFYDLEVAPATFDVIAFLTLAELYRKEVGCDVLHLVIVPGPEEGFRKNDFRGYLRDGPDLKFDIMNWRLSNIVTQCCWLIPACQKLTICSSREEANALQATLVKYVFPKGYSVRYPQSCHEVHNLVEASSRGLSPTSVQSTPQAHEYVSNWTKTNVGERKLISITLRESVYELPRNSNIKNWGAFARSLDQTIYCPVIIRDTDAAFHPLPPDLKGILIFPEVVWNIQLRVALYELSYLNMFIPNGPSMICFHSQKAPFIYFLKKVTCGAATHEYWQSQGVEPGSKFKWLNSFQTMVWEGDDYDVLVREFEKMCELIEGSKDKELTRI
jgi:hypothetical protein